MRKVGRKAAEVFVLPDGQVEIVLDHDFAEKLKGDFGPIPLPPDGQPCLIILNAKPCEPPIYFRNHDVDSRKLAEWFRDPGDKPNL